MRGTRSLPAISPFALAPVEPVKSRAWGQSSLDKALRHVNAEKEDAIRAQCPSGNPGLWTQDSLDAEINRIKLEQEASLNVENQLAASCGRSQDELDVAILRANKCLPDGVSATGPGGDHRGEAMDTLSSIMASALAASPRGLKRGILSPTARRAQPCSLPHGSSLLGLRQDPLSPSTLTQDALDAEFGRLCRLRSAQAAMSKDLVNDSTPLASTKAIVHAIAGPSRTTPAQGSSISPLQSASAPARLGAAAHARLTAAAICSQQLAETVTPSTSAATSPALPVGRGPAPRGRVRFISPREGESAEGPVSVRPGASTSGAPSQAVQCASVSVPSQGDSVEGLVRRRPGASTSGPPSQAVQCAPLPVPSQRPESPWATSSSAYGAHSSAASSSSASAAACTSSGRARIEAARLRTLALRSAC